MSRRRGLKEEFVGSLPKPLIYGPAQPGVLPLTTEPTPVCGHEACDGHGLGPDSPLRDDLTDVSGLVYGQERESRANGGRAPL